MPTTYTTPTTAYAWPTGTRLLDRVRITRGLCVITDGNGGWKTVEFPYLGDLGSVNPITSATEGLVEGTDYFLGGHNYAIDCATGLSLYNAGLFPDYPNTSCVLGAPTFPSSLTYPSDATIPGGL